jgi:hypothetical protein
MGDQSCRKDAAYTRVGIEPTIPVFGRTKAFCASARTATVIQIIQNWNKQDILEYFKFRQIRANKKIKSHIVNKKRLN